MRRVYCGAGRGGRTRQDAARRAAERAPPGTNRAKRRVCLTTAGAPNFRRGGRGGGGLSCSCRGERAARDKLTHSMYGVEIGASL